MVPPMRARALAVLLVGLCAACSAVLGIGDVPPSTSAQGGAAPALGGSPPGALGDGPADGDRDPESAAAANADADANAETDAAIGADAATPDEGPGGDGTSDRGMEGASGEGALGPSGLDAPRGIEEATDEEGGRPADRGDDGEAGAGDAVPDGAAADEGAPPGDAVEATFACEAGQTVCDDAGCVSLRSDPAHCGSCGWACADGMSCVEGVCQCSQASCQPALFASGTFNPSGIVVAGGDVYWTSETPFPPLESLPAGSVWRCAASGCSGKPILVATNQNEPSDITADATSLYWVNFTDGSVAKAPLGASNAVAQVLYPPGGDESGDIAVDATSVYWSQFVLGSLLRCPLRGCGDAGAATTVYGGPGSPLQIALLSGSIYFIYLPEFDGGMVLSCPVSGCAGAPSVIASNLNPSGLAVDASGNYIADSQAGTVVQCPLTGCAPPASPVVLATGQNTPSVLRLDGDHLYVLNLGTLFSALNDGSIVRIALHGGPTVTLAAGLVKPVTMAIDPTSVYWTSPNDLSVPDSQTGTVMRVPK
jgi:hypothetical protein